jgi:hypothetical protein
VLTTLVEEGLGFRLSYDGKDRILTVQWSAS